MFENLVVAVDGSPCANHALAVALALARVEGSKLAVCSIADPAPVYGTLEPAVLVERTLAEIRAHAQHSVDDALATAKATGIEAQGSALDGEPVYEITRYAEHVHADAIVIGTHGRSGLKRLLMGSVAEGVLRLSPVPVITVRTEARIASLAPAAAS
jgi:nucleotide-binding universal stress UspA family protein